MSALLAIDPGRTTGIAWCDSLALLPARFDTRLGHLLGHQQIGGGMVEQARRIVRGVERMDVRVVVVESFQLRPGVALKGAGALAPVELGAMLEFALDAMDGSGVVLEWQTAAQGKSVMTDERMRAMGCWWKGQPHAVDAGRHLLTFVRRVRSGKVTLDEEVWR